MSVGNKKGYELVEGTIAMPIIILTVISFIFAMIFLYSSLNDSCSLHGELIEKSLESRTLYKNHIGQANTSMYIGGILKDRLNRRLDEKISIRNEAELVMMGDQAKKYLGE